jgi:hypothetical protein
MKRHPRLGEYPVSNINCSVYHSKVHIIHYSMADMLSIRISSTYYSLRSEIGILDPTWMYAHATQNWHSICMISTHSDTIRCCRCYFWPYHDREQSEYYETYRRCSRVLIDSADSILERINTFTMPLSRRRPRKALSTVPPCSQPPRKPVQTRRSRHRERYKWNEL